MATVLSRLRSLFSSPPNVILEDVQIDWDAVPTAVDVAFDPPRFPRFDVKPTAATLHSVNVFVEHLLGRHMSFPPPCVYVEDESVLFSWRTRDGKHLDIEFYNDGLCEWFYRDIPNNITHGVDDRVDVRRLHPQFWKCIDLVRASIDDYMLEDNHEAHASMFKNICAALEK